MGWFLTTFITGATSFIATNIDDIVILTLFFSQINANFRPRHIIIGQYLGFIVLIIFSLPGFFGGLFIPETWIGLLGLLPICIGIYHLFNAEDDDTPMVQAVSCESDLPKAERSLMSVLSHLLAPQIYHVAAVTIANGGDNIGIYIPLFASSNWAGLFVILCTFFTLIGVWCLIAGYLSRHSVITPILSRYGEMVVPYVLIGLGIFILLENGSYRLLPNLF